MYINILDECLWPIVAKYFLEREFIFQEDNAPIHKAKKVKYYMSNNNIDVLPWPAYSPDLNPIENCWAAIKQKLQKEIHLVTSSDDLGARVQKIWSELSSSYIKGLYESMPRRLRRVQVLKGHLTKY